MPALNAVKWLAAILVLAASAGTVFAAQGLDAKGKPVTVSTDKDGKPLSLPEKAEVIPETLGNKSELLKRNKASAALSAEERRARLLQMYSKKAKVFRSNPRRATESLSFPSPAPAYGSAAKNAGKKPSPVPMIIGSVFTIVLIILLVVRMKRREANKPIRVGIPRLAPGDVPPVEPPPDRRKQMDWVEDYMKQQDGDSEPEQHESYSDFD
ncbi:MAG: hypothetical protein E3J72_10430 [Planctomycetota bacterium]|nr:MAG: hypothetical protein E3J72_10430 [Planctomycetota bacterium]